MPCSYWPQSMWIQSVCEGRPKAALAKAIESLKLRIPDWFRLVP